VSINTQLAIIYVCELTDLYQVVFSVEIRDVMQTFDAWLKS